MTMTKEEQHKCKFEKPQLIRVPVQDRKAKYAFTGNTKGMVLKTCKCGKDTAVDYGDYTDIINKYKKGSNEKL